MELDINTDSVNFTSYRAVDRAREPQPRATGPNSSPTMTGTPPRYFEPWWARDFITMSAESSTYDSQSARSSGRSLARDHP